MSAPVLALESSTPEVTCAIRAGDREVEVRRSGRAVETLDGCVTDALAEAAIAARDLGGIIVGGGPGSVIGVRAGVSFANALSYAVGCPVGVVGGLDSMAFAAGGADGEHSVVALEAGRGRVYVARHRREGGVLLREGGPRLIEAGQLDALLASCPPGTRLHVDTVPTAAGHLRLAAAVPDLAAGGAVASARPLAVERPHA